MNVALNTCSYCVLAWLSDLSPMYDIRIPVLVVHRGRCHGNGVYTSTA